MPGPDDLAQLEEGARAFPEWSALVLRTAQWDIAGDRRDTAARLLRLALMQARDPQYKKVLEQLAGELRVDGAGEVKP